MLVLSSHVSEQILINTSDGPISVMLVRTEPGRARLGFEAPKNVRILRRSLQEKLPMEASDAEK